MPSPAAAPPVKPGELELSPFMSGVSWYAFDFCWWRFRSIQMIMPSRTSARGMPTAHPTITPSFELIPLPDFKAPLLLLSVVAVGFDVLITRTVTGTVTTPAVPEERLILTEVNGTCDIGGALAERVPAEEGAFDDAAEICETESLLAVPLARPVTVETVGLVAAWLEPMVAYAFPS